ncbi:uncharacterized protein VTP21DRAFT_2091 [Calcarisporiella thermophila]|uniref:uncharacterized protein n=1 Tax=Calcarisporiella thermophila TaxID=911321 RepID=UPI00374459B8
MKASCSAEIPGHSQLSGHNLFLSSSSASQEAAESEIQRTPFTISVDLKISTTASSWHEESYCCSSLPHHPSSPRHTSSLKATLQHEDSPFIPSSTENSGHTSKVPLLSHHMNDSTPYYKCTYSGCGKGFTRLYNLKSHMRTHVVDKPYRCTRCSQAFSRNHDLKRHMKIHDGIKPYLCGCGKAFSRMDALRRHRANSKTRIICGEEEHLMVEEYKVKSEEPSSFGLPQLNFRSPIMESKTLPSLKDAVMLADAKDVRLPPIRTLTAGMPTPLRTMSL